MSDPRKGLILPQPLTEPFLLWGGEKSIAMRRRETQPVRKLFIFPADPKWLKWEFLLMKVIICAGGKAAAFVSLQIKLLDNEGPAAFAPNECPPVPQLPE